MPSQKRLQDIDKYVQSVDVRMGNLHRSVNALNSEINQLQERIYFSINHARSNSAVDKSNVARMEAKVALEYGKSLRKYFAELDEELLGLLKEYKASMESFLSTECED
jgi:archaellum component FlaC